MTDDERAAYIIGMKLAHDEIQKAFNKQLEAWWTFIPFVGIPRILRRCKLLRISKYLVKQADDLYFARWEPSGSLRRLYPE